MKKNEDLRKKNVISELRYLELEAQRDIAAAAGAEAGIQVRGDEIKITETKLYSPFAGVMSRPTVAEGTISASRRPWPRLRARSNLGQGLRALSSLR